MKYDRWGNKTENKPDPAVTIGFIKKESFNLQIVMNQWVNDPLKGHLPLGFKYQGLSTIWSKNRRSFSGEKWNISSRNLKKFSSLDLIFKVQKLGAGSKGEGRPPILLLDPTAACGGQQQSFGGKWKLLSTYENETVKK